MRFTMKYHIYMNHLLNSSFNANETFIYHMFLFTELVLEKGVTNITLNFGPQHPAAHGVLRLVLELNGEVGPNQFYAVICQCNNFFAYCIEKEICFLQSV